MCVPGKSCPRLAPSCPAGSRPALEPPWTTASLRGRPQPSLSPETARRIPTSWHSSRPDRTSCRRSVSSKCPAGTEDDEATSPAHPACRSNLLGATSDCHPVEKAVS
uniref:Kinesin family member 6 n=1 Tax=Molossus molossus TaxID=27622 RepID=A0A7J8GQB9_MOLMO|nr:kinesin family member 6 [Molossus molossus]